MQIQEFEMSQSVEKVQYPDLSQYIPAYAQQNENLINQNDQKMQERKEFLLKFYINSLNYYMIALVVFVCGFSDGILQLVTKFSLGTNSGYYYSFNEYQKYYGQLRTEEEFQQFRQNNIYLITSPRWTYYLFFGLLILNIATVVIGRFNQHIIKKQKMLYFVQSILLGLTFMGMAGQHRDTSWQWRNYFITFISILSGLMGNSSILIILTQYDKLHLYHHLKIILIYSSFGINLILAMIYGNVKSNVILVEMIIYYGFYYFHQLNNSLLIDPNQLPEQVSFFTMLSRFFESPDHQQQYLASQVPQLGNDYVVINKRQIMALIFVCAIVILIFFTITSYHPIYRILLILLVSSVFLMAFDTQIASNKLNPQDHYLAASILIVDILSPFKNIIRSFS